jgi:hypothetical protein
MPTNPNYINTIQLKRGQEATRTTITPLEGELLLTMDTHKLYAGDGSTPGGFDLFGNITGNFGTAATYDAGNNPGQLPIIGADGKLSTFIIPALAYTETYVVNSEAEMLNLTAAGAGDVAVRTDLNQSFIMSGTDPTLLDSWTMLLTPTDSVISVNGQSGVVVLTKADIGLSNVENKSISEILNNAALTGVPTAPTPPFDAVGNEIITAAWMVNYTNDLITQKLDLRYMSLNQPIDGGSW